MNHATEDQLNDYVDGVLPPAQQAALEAHLSACAPCAAELAALRALVGSVHALPRAVRPERDLLADIRGTIERERLIELPATRRRALWSMRAPLAAAAVLLIVLTSVITQQAASKKQRAQEAQPAGAAVLVNAEIRSEEEQYLRAIADLQTMLSAQSELTPETRLLLQHSLRVIDQAIRESKEAVQRDPANALVIDMLRSAYEKKLDVLRRAAAVTAT